MSSFGSSHRVFEVPGEAFAGAQRKFSADGKVLGPEAAKREMADERLMWLARGFMDGNLPAKTQAAFERLLAERHLHNKQIDAVIQEWSSAARAHLEKEVERVKAECRKQTEAINKLREKRDDLQQQLNGLIAEEGERSAEHRAAVEDLRSLSRYAPAKTVEQAKQRVAKAENGLREVRARKSPIEDAMNEINLKELPQEFEKMRRLDAELVRLRATLSGEAYQDPEFGLVVPPGSF